jgi:hypothetical protein
VCVKKKKSHTIAKELVKTCALKIAKMLSPEAQKNTDEITLSNNVIQSGFMIRGKIFYSKL